MKPTTLKDLSRHLSLSTSTISRALLNHKNIHPETRKRVLEAAEMLGYQPNTTALNLRYGKSKSIGLVVPEMVTPFSANVLKGIQAFLNNIGYKVIILVSDESPDTERDNLTLLERFNVDGIILNLCHETYNQALYAQIMERGTPIVFFDRIPGNALDVSKVIVNDHIQASLMAEHLISTGCKRIVHLMGPPTVRNATERAAGYQRILVKHGIFDPELMVKTHGTTFGHGKEAVKELLKKGIAFDSIFAFTDTLAIGAMNYLLEQGIRVPEEVAICSFSGTELSTSVFPQLSSVEQPLKEMGEAAARLLMDKIQDSSSDSRTLVLDAKLIYRGSTARGSGKH
ncbi:LacI family transcriptional regulator [Dyadobacter jejuensis]|uniref:LacI family transcriptional regulator n=1 Tax=Dyadobacter jejuensis TaxID=1082580 RepID=A0A316AGX3_9BACT|nr:LacI family DNA-binding transcriptional regulator [Dyadobacter jejuensis]PWJ57056.1 LacI family transcriptional regulator [Dyadobacter jejuensis]